MKGLRMAAGAVNAVCLVLLALYFSVQLPTFSTWFYEYEYAKNGTYEQVQVEKEDLLAVTAHMIDYMRGKEANLNIETHVAGEARLFFSEREVLHMEDVLGLFQAGRWIRNVSVMLFAATAAFLIASGKDWRSVIMKAWRAAAFGMLAGFACLGGLMAVSFDRSFTLFHEIFFNNDLWLLDPRVDLLVNIVPTPFFMDIALCIGIMFALALAVMGTCAAVILRGIHRQGEALQ